MLNRELIGWRDVWRCFAAALALTLVVCGGSYLGAGGPVPGMTTADAAVSAPVRAVQMDPQVTLAAPRVLVVKTARAAPAGPRSYQVRPGDSLSSISARLFGSSRYWTSIYWANSKSIKYANIIEAGQTLVIPAIPRVLAAPRVLSPAPPPLPQRPVVPVVTADSQSASPVGQSQTSTLSSGYAVTSSFQACVIRAESGGNAQIWNASGHYGLYQFSYSTWLAYGGAGADFGHASAAEQTQVFDNAMAAGGESNWAPYDGC